MIIFQIEHEASINHLVQSCVLGDALFVIVAPGTRQWAGSLALPYVLHKTVEPPFPKSH